MPPKAPWLRGEVEGVRSGVGVDSPWEEVKERLFFGLSQGERGLSSGVQPGLTACGKGSALSQGFALSSVIPAGY